MTDCDREAFEAWLFPQCSERAHPLWTERRGESYAHPVTRGSWEGWQAALAHAREAGAQEPVAWQYRMRQYPTNEWSSWLEADAMVSFRPNTDTWQSRALYDHPAPAQEPVAVPDALVRDDLIQHLEAEFGDAYDCTRVWGAWSYGTMGPDDFTPLSERAAEIADGILALIPAAPVSPAADSGESRLREAVRKAVAVAGEDHTGCNPQMVAKRISDLLKEALASHTPAPQPGGAVKVELVSLLNGVGDCITLHGAKALSLDIAVEMLKRVKTFLSALEPSPAQWNAGAEAPAAWRDVLSERQRQVSAEGWSPEHDDQHSTGALALAASCYARFAAFSEDGRKSTEMSEVLTTNGRTVRGWGSLCDLWPWDRHWWKPSTRRRDLVKAGALILAEIERLDRLPLPTPAGEG